MAIPLTELLAAVGMSVQDAQNAMERHAITSYLGYFQKLPAGDHEGENSDAPDAVAPITRHIAVPAPDGEGPKVVAMPLAAFAQHNTLQLDSVTVKLNAATSIRPEDNALLLEVGSTGGEGANGEEAPCPSSQLELVFRTTTPSEGIARVSQSMLTQI